MSEAIAGALGLGLLGLIIYEIEKKKKEQSQTQTQPQPVPQTQPQPTTQQPTTQTQTQTITIQPQTIEPQTILTNLNAQTTQPPQTQPQPQKVYTPQLPPCEEIKREYNPDGSYTIYCKSGEVRYIGWTPKIICRPIYTTEISKVLDKLSLNFGYIEFVQAQKYYQPQYCDNTLGEKTPQGDPFYIFYIKYQDPFGYIQFGQGTYITNNIFKTSYGDMLNQVKTQWPLYWPERVQNPNYPKLVQDLENIYSFIDKYKNKVNYVETGVNLTQ